MRIAYVHTGLWPSKTPSMTFATYNAIGLAENIDEVVFYIKKNSSRSSDHVLRDEFGLDKPDNLIIRQMRKPFFRSNHLYYRRVAREITGSRGVKRFDAVITRSLTFLPYMVRMAESSGIPVYFETHDFFSNLEIRDDLGKKKKTKQQRIEREYIPRITGLICLQESQKELYRRIYPGVNMIVARTGIHMAVRTGGKRKYITYIGSLDPLKGVDLFLEALGRTSSRPDALIIGGKSQKEITRLEAASQRFYPSGSVKITGWVSKESIGRYLAETAVGVLPLRDTFFNRFVSSPLKLFDYYSYGIPVIASDLPATRELIEEDRTGCFFRAGDPGDLAVTIDSMIGDSSLLERMRGDIYTVCEKYLWSRRGKQIADLVESDIEQNRRGRSG
ncbi:MAG: glycosyltransferase family 4 protein [Candidatus Krumholzibacteriota bacterium]|nr:glycosyltransferase family 4 protein [Candidatus Krumholzibacteriota bacterium]